MKRNLERKEAELAQSEAEAERAQSVSQVPSILGSSGSPPAQLATEALARLDDADFEALRAHWLQRHRSPKSGSERSIQLKEQVSPSREMATICEDDEIDMPSHGPYKPQSSSWDVIRASPQIMVL